MEDKRRTHENAVAFLKALDIKKATVGGFDKIATFEKFKEFSALYEDLLEDACAHADMASSEAKANREALVSSNEQLVLLRERLKEKEALADSLQKRLSEKEEQTAPLQEKEVLVDSLQKQLSDKEAEIASLKESMSLLSAEAAKSADEQRAQEDDIKAAKADLAAERLALEHMRRAMTDEKNTILTEARLEADRICREGQEEALRYRASVIEDVKKAQQTKELILSELDVIQSQIASLRSAPEVAWMSHDAQS